MERHELENSREFKAAKELEHALNDYGWNEKRFASAVTTFHRTLQQTLFRSMVSSCLPELLIPLSSYISHGKPCSSGHIRNLHFPLF